MILFLIVVIFHNIIVFTVFSDQITAALVNIRDFQIHMKKKIM